LYAAQAGVPDLGEPLRLRLPKGSLESVSRARLLDGANLLAIGDGGADNWELLQFGRAELVEPGIWEISERLRGQAGSDAIMPEVWPAGSMVVLMNGAPAQIDLALGARGLARHYRVGSAVLGYDDASYVHRVEAFDGIGLRPYAPCHLRVQMDGGDAVARWIRRTRIDGDSWAGSEVPLGEAFEAYLVRVVEGSVIRREDIIELPEWVYPATAQAEDGIAGPYEIHVAQLSDAFGAGPFARIQIHG
ncbi:MAG: host specificity protein, partial [Phaeovulum sp.]|nr:host specificity protein [Phaeovulum sp.]